MKLNFFKSKIFFIVISLILIISLSFVTSYTNASGVYFNGTTRKVPIYSVDRDDNKIAISFDCAYGADYTQNLLDTLNEYNVKCTFFTVEFWVTKYPEVVKKIVDNGHEIGTHSKTHPYMSKLTESEIESELNSSINAITSITNQPVTLFRAPYGDYNNKVIETAGKLNLKTIQWDVDSLDWKDLTTEQIVNKVVPKVKSGSIILCHNNGLSTYKALPYILANLKEKGYEFVPISKLIYENNYVIDSFGVQHLNK